MRARAAAGLLFVSVALLAGCGAKGNSATQGETERDAKIVNVAIGQEMALVDAYRHAGAYLRAPRSRAILRRYVAQEQEHINGWTKAMRGLGGQVEAKPAALDYSGIEGERSYLLFAYELTGSELTHFLEDVTQLSTPAPQSFAASTAASEAQHLVVLRQLLGSGLLGAVPQAFDTGEVPPPEGSGTSHPPPGKG